MISRVTKTEVLAHCRETLGIFNNQDVSIDEALLTDLVRRSAGIHCPCSRSTLRHSILECTKSLPTIYESASFPEAIDDVIEALIVGGDLLELDDDVIDDSNVGQPQVALAPPGFVVRKSGSVFLFGIVPDQDTFLPSTLAERVLQRGFTRLIEPKPGEDISGELLELGLQKRPERAWVKCPKTEDSADLLARHQRLLADGPPSSEIPDLKILDSTRPVTCYRGRWTEPTAQHGDFVARRPQEYGAPIWCLVKLEDGQPVRLLDLPLKHSRWRGCDVAWYLQSAIDHCRGAPQRYRRRIDGDDIRLDFFSPLPQWSERRLMLIGRSVPPDECLLSYVIPENEADAEEEFLKKNLWLSLDDESAKEHSP